MFGHQDDKQHDESSYEDTTVAPDQPGDEVVDAGSTDHGSHSNEHASDEGAGSTVHPDNTDDATPASDDDDTWQHPGAPLEDGAEGSADDDKSPEPIKDIIGSNAGPDFKPFRQNGGEDGDNRTENTPHELIDLKQKALSDLMPLFGKLEQSPEDKFRTTMMMIQASDDQSLIQSAYDAAHEIKDEKARAQALLDIVNEINYFTQHPEN